MDQSWISRSLDDTSDQMEQLLTRPTITYDGKGILIFEPYSKSKPTDLYWECL